MTTAQQNTAKQIVASYYEHVGQKPITADLGDRKIQLNFSGPCLHPHYRILDQGKILFGVGMESSSYDSMSISIQSWKIIRPDGTLVDPSDYTDEERALADRPVEVNAFNSRAELIRF